jgi:hypothetical protein
MMPNSQDNTAIRAKLMQLLQQAAQVAASNGIDFKQLLMEVLQGGQSSPPPPPPTSRPEPSSQIPS